MNERILLSLPVVPIRQGKTLCSHFHFHWGHDKLFCEQNSQVTEVLLHHHHPQIPRVPDEPPHTTCWSESSSGCGRGAGPTRHKRQTFEPSAQTRKEKPWNTALHHRLHSPNTGWVNRYFNILLTPAILLCNSTGLVIYQVCYWWICIVSTAAVALLS